jgi:hypothetical protein
VGSGRGAQALTAQGTVAAVARGPGARDGLEAVQIVVLAVAVPPLAGRTEAVGPILGRSAAFRAEPLGRACLGALVPQGIGCGLMPRRLGVARIALAVAGVGDVGLEFARLEWCAGGRAVIAGVGGQDRVRRTRLAERIDSWAPELLRPAHAMGLGLDDDLVLLIDRRHPGVALDDSRGSGHLGRLVVGAVALASRALGDLAILGMLLQPLAELSRVALGLRWPVVTLAIARLMMPLLSASRTILSCTPGGEAGAPTASFLTRAAKTARARAWSRRC